MVRDIFISYASEDKSAADKICTRLESYGLQCWIAPRNISVGEKYAPAIIHAIDESKIVVVVFSHNADQSAHIRTEIERAFNHEKIIIPFRIENIEPSDEVQFYIGSRQWLDGFSGSLDEHIDRLADIIKKHLSKEPEFPGTQEKMSSSLSKSVKTINEGDFPGEGDQGKFFHVIRRSLSYCIDFLIGVGIGYLFPFLFGFFARVIIGTDKASYLFFIPNSDNLTVYGIWITLMLYLAGIIFWFTLIDISRFKSPGKALTGLKIYWPPDKVNSDKWKIIRSLIKNGPLLMGLLWLFLNSSSTSAMDLTLPIGIFLWIIWLIPIIFTSKSQSIHDIVVGTVVYSGKK